jgi:hypothetical protein
LTVTLLVYQPFMPSVPVIASVISTSAVGAAAPAPPARSRQRSAARQEEAATDVGALHDPSTRTVTSPTLPGIAVGAEVIRVVITMSMR